MHCFALFLTLFSTLILSLSATTSPEFTTIHDQNIYPLLTPTFTHRQTKKIRLNNGLEAFLVSDPNVDKSSAALIVKTGSWEEPAEYPGIAHFLEHMLFLGNKKYPKESDFSKFINEHGGMTNAMTSDDYTGYMFSINNADFSAALDRFAHFFKEPLFNPSGVDRELQAIDQEYAKNLENETFRRYFVHKELSIPTHPFHAFNIGNKQTLAKVSQNTLKQWYQQHYSANRMRVIAISSMPMDELQKLVIEEFKEIPDHHLEPFHLDLPKTPTELKGHMVYIEPIKEIQRLTLTWEMPSKFSKMRDSKPEQIACFVLGHEGQNSLLAELKKEKYATGLGCGSLIISDTMDFIIQIELTNLGVKHVNDVIKMCFQAINNFQKKGVPAYLFEEQQTLDAINYQYQDRKDAFQHIFELTALSPHEEFQTFPMQSYIIQHFDPKAAEEFLDYLTPERCVFDLAAPPSLTGVPPEHTEQWLHVPYTVKAISSDLLKEWKNAPPSPHIDLPPPNPFIPTSLKLVNPIINTSTEIEIPHPVALVNDDKATIYFAPDEGYHEPKISWFFEIKTPSITPINAQSIVLGDLYVQMVKDALSSYIYPASLAGLSVDIQRTENGISINIDGFSDKAQELFFDVINELKKFYPREKKFRIFKEELLKQYQNAGRELPYIQAINILRNFIHKDYVSDKEKVALIKKSTFSQFEEFSATIFQKTYVEGMLFGNLTEAAGKQLSSQLIQALGSAPYPKAERFKKVIMIPPQKEGPLLSENKTTAQGNATILAIALPPFTFKERAAQQILMQAMKEPFFYTLRTKQQTGYIVISQAEDIEKQLFNLFVVQSNTHDPRDLLARFELFIEGFLQELQTEVSQEHFETIKQSLLTTLRQPPKSIAAMGALLNKIAFTYDADFNWTQQRIQGFEELSYDEFIALAYKTMSKSNKQRLAILLSGVVSPDHSLQYKKFSTLNKLKEELSPNQ